MVMEKDIIDQGELGLRSLGKVDLQAFFFFTPWKLYFQSCGYKYPATYLVNGFVILHSDCDLLHAGRWAPAKRLIIP